MENNLYPLLFYSYAKYTNICAVIERTPKHPFLEKFSAKLAIFDLDGTLVEFPREFLFSESERIMKLISHPEVERSVMLESFADFDFFRFLLDSLEIFNLYFVEEESDPGHFRRSESSTGS